MHQELLLQTRFSGASLPWAIPCTENRFCCTFTLSHRTKPSCCWYKLLSPTAHRPPSLLVVNFLTTIITRMEIQLASKSRMVNNTHPQRNSHMRGQCKSLIWGGSPLTQNIGESLMFYISITVFTYRPSAVFSLIV